MADSSSSFPQNLYLGEFPAGWVSWISVRVSIWGDSRRLSPAGISACVLESPILRGSDDLNLESDSNSWKGYSLLLLGLRGIRKFRSLRHSSCCEVRSFCYWENSWRISACDLESPILGGSDLGLNLESDSNSLWDSRKGYSLLLLGFFPPRISVGDCFSVYFLRD